MRSVSLIIVAHNEESKLRACLNSLVQQTKLPNEWILIDNNSSDQTFALLQDFKCLNPEKKVVVISRSVNHLALARNEAVEASTSEFVAFIDADCEAPPEWLETLCHRWIHLKGLYPKLAGVGGPNRLPSHRGPLADGINWALDGPLGWFRSPQSWRPTSDCEIDHLATTNALFLKEALFSIGGFSSNFVTCGEDLDLGRRLTHSGWQLIYGPYPIVFNDCAASLSEWLRRLYRFGQVRTNTNFIRTLSLTVLTIGAISWATFSNGWNYWVIWIALCPLLVTGLLWLLVPARSFSYYLLAVIASPVAYGLGALTKTHSREE